MVPLPDLKPAPSILFITNTWIGDAVLSTGVLRHVLERYDHPRLTIACGTISASLFRCVPGAERVVAVAKRRHALHWLDLLREVGGRRWDLVLDLKGSALPWLLRARYRRVVAKGDPETHRVVQLGTMLGVSPPPAPMLWLSAANEDAARHLIPTEEPVLALAPATSGPRKQWPMERFAELARRLTGPGGALAHAPVAIFAAAHERAMIAPVLEAAARGRSFEVIGERDLLTVAAALRRTRLFIGNDSGVMHMAAAAGVPTLGLFGPTRPARTAPWGRHTAVVQTDKSYAELVGAPGYDPRTSGPLMDSLSVDKVEAAARSLIRSDVAAALPLG